MRHLPAAITPPRPRSRKWECEGEHYVDALRHRGRHQITARGTVGPEQRQVPFRQVQEEGMADSVYRVTEVIGVSEESWEAAARSAVATAARTVRDLRVAEVVRQDVTIGDGAVVNFRVRLAISFKYETGD
jgi:dodecin